MWSLIPLGSSVVSDLQSSEVSAFQALVYTAVCGDACTCTKARFLHVKTFGIAEFQFCYCPLCF